MKEAFLSKFFSTERPFTAKVRFWSYVGPFFLVIAFAFIVLQISKENIGLLTAACIGVIFCWKWDLRGFMAALLILFLVALWDFGHAAIFPFSKVGLNAAISFSLLIIALAQKEIAGLIDASTEETSSLHDQIRGLRLQVQEEKAIGYSKLDSAQQEIEFLKKENGENKERNESLVKLLRVAKEEFEHLKQANEKFQSEIQAQTGTFISFQLEIAALKDQAGHEGRKLVHQLNEVRVENFQLSLLQDAHDLQIAKMKTDLARLSNEIKTAISVDPITIDKNLNFELMYGQLRKQFEDKSEVLHKTRKELFEMEGKLLALQKQNEQTACEPYFFEMEFAQSLKLATAESRDLEVQIEELEQLIATLVGPKKRKKKVL